MQLRSSIGIRIWCPLIFLPEGNLENISPLTPWRQDCSHSLPPLTLGADLAWKAKPKEEIGF